MDNRTSAPSPGTITGSPPADQAAEGSSTDVDQDRLTLLFTIYNERLVRTLRARLGSNWHLADDLAQDTWLLVTRKLHTCRATDDRAFPWISTVARTATTAHFRRARNVREAATDFSGAASRMLPSAPAAEDVAVSRIIALMLAADSPAPLGVAA